jgi:hypothetical protein
MAPILERAPQADLAPTLDLSLLLKSKAQPSNLPYSRFENTGVPEPSRAEGALI